jgi:hypothetical protein
VSRWCDLRRKSPNAYTRNIIALGDFNLPKAEPGDAIYEALTKRGLRLPQHSTALGSSVKKDKHYDQIAFFPPGETEEALVQASAVFDWDGPINPSLYDGALPSTLITLLAKLRTDLDRFAPEEADLLSYHGYWSTHARLGALHPQLAITRPAWRDYAVLAAEEIKQLELLLVRGARRLRLPTP